MVQMKGLKLLLLFSWTKNFISHMVQMKVLSLDVKSSERFELYIPHGSDERASELPCPLCCLFFISHMVQMKENYKYFHPKFVLVFISHMVQMKVILCLFLLNK